MKAYSVLVQEPDWDNIGELVFAPSREEAKRFALVRNGDLREAVNEGAFLHIMRHKNVDHIAQQYSKPVCVYSVEIQRQCGWLVEGDAQCATCGLYSMDGVYEVCENCHNCIECRCDDGCEPFIEEHKSCRKQELGKMTFEEWFKKWWGERTDGPYKSINVESIARAAWEAALTHDPAKAHAEPVAFAQVLENGDLRISANGLRVLSKKLDKSRVMQPLYLQPKAKKCEN